MNTTIAETDLLDVSTDRVLPGNDALLDAGVLPTLESLRNELDRVDAALVAGISERLRIARAIGAVKRSQGLPVVDRAREAAVVRRAVGLAREAALDAEDLRHIFWCLVGLSKRVQTNDAR